MEAGIRLVVQMMMSRYGDQAAASAANRARVLEACGDRDTSRYWDLVRQQIDEFEQFPPRRGHYFSSDDPDLVAAIREAVFGDGAVRDEPDDGAEYEGDADTDANPFEPDIDLKPSWITRRSSWAAMCLEITALPRPTATPSMSA